MDAQKLIDVSHQQVINKESTIVFNYFSDFRNDKLWRKEINKTDIDTSIIQVNTKIVEHSYLSGKVPDYVSTLTCTDLQPGKLIVSESVSENMFWAKSTRIVEPINESKCRISYRIQFDIDIVKHGLGMALPKFFVSFYTKQTMKKYMNQLKKKLE